MTPDERQRVLQDHVAMLREHFDNVQIFCSSVDDEDTTKYHAAGSGNYFARLGQVRDYVTKRDALDEAQFLNKALGEDQYDHE